MVITWIRGVERWLDAVGMRRAVLLAVTLAAATGVAVARVGLQGLDRMAAVTAQRPGADGQALGGTVSAQSLAAAYRPAHNVLVLVVGLGLLALTAVGVLEGLALVRWTAGLVARLEEGLGRAGRRVLGLAGAARCEGSGDLHERSPAPAGPGADLGDLLRAQAASVHLLGARISQLERGHRAPGLGRAATETEELPWWLRPTPGGGP